MHGRKENASGWGTAPRRESNASVGKLATALIIPLRPPARNRCAWCAYESAGMLCGQCGAWALRDLLLQERGRLLRAAA